MNFPDLNRLKIANAFMTDMGYGHIYVRRRLTEAFTTDMFEKTLNETARTLLTNLQAFLFSTTQGEWNEADMFQISFSPKERFFQFYDEMNFPENPFD